MLKGSLNPQSPSPKNHLSTLSKLQPLYQNIKSFSHSKLQKLKSTLPSSSPSPKLPSSTSPSKLNSKREKFTELQHLLEASKSHQTFESLSNLAKRSSFKSEVSSILLSEFRDQEPMDGTIGTGDAEDYVEELRLKGAFGSRMKVDVLCKDTDGKVLVAMLN